jgi:hypothetical protein
MAIVLIVHFPPLSQVGVDALPASHAALLAHHVASLARPSMRPMSCAELMCGATASASA